MATYPYTSNPGRVKELLQKIQDVGVPSKVTNKYLESLGYKSKNDRAMLSVLRALNFVDASGVPTETWRKFRNKGSAKGVMASAIRATYKDLFTTYPDAYRRDNEALRNFFSSHTDVGEGGLRYMVATFKSLTELADFGAEPVDLSDDSDEKSDETPDGGGEMKTVRRKGNGLGSGVTMNINIQLQIPETDKPEVYENFFAAMKKHLLT
jgi:hypothetical protein